MRNTFDQALDSLTTELVEMAALAGTAVSRASAALLEADLELAEGVIAADATLDERYRALEASAVDLLARQQPVATDLRRVVTALRISADLERMGDMAEHVASVAQSRHPRSVVPDDLRATVQQMGEIAERMCDKTRRVIAEADADAALELETDDDAMDSLHDEVYARIRDAAWPGGVDSAIDLALVARYYERYADHAVGAANRVIYHVLGEYRTDEED